MELTAREDIEAPIGDVFRAITDFDRFERVLLRRGAEVVRTDDLTEPGAGLSWRIGFDLRGKRRHIDLELTELAAPEKLSAIGRGPDVNVHLDVQLIALSRRRTRMQTRTELTAGSLSGRMLLHPLRLARGRILKRYRGAAADFAARIEARARADDRA